MNRALYWKQRILLLLLHLFCMTALSLFLRINGNSLDSVILILVCWGLILGGWLTVEYMRKVKQVNRLFTLAEETKERYLLAEIMEKPLAAEEQIYYRILKMGNKAMLEVIGEGKREQKEYQEYIEQWVHEIKTPITALKLLCENHRSAFTKEFSVELEKIERYTEQTLYYARSGHTQNDYSVREMPLFGAVHRAIAEHKYLLLTTGMNVEAEETACTVFSDEKWICFILGQFIANAVKYKSETGKLKFYAEQESDKVILVTEDNGIGIEAGDLPRIFEKGFTGENGRKRQNSTGIGLYLCKRLCDKLGIGIRAESDEGGTRMYLSFQVNHYIRQVREK